MVAAQVPGPAPSYTHAPGSTPPRFVRGQARKARPHRPESWSASTVEALNGEKVTLGAEWLQRDLFLRMPEKVVTTARYLHWLRWEYKGKGMREVYERRDRMLQAKPMAGVTERQIEYAFAWLRRYGLLSTRLEIRRRGDGTFYRQYTHTVNWCEYKYRRGDSVDNPRVGLTVEAKNGLSAKALRGPHHGAKRRKGGKQTLGQDPANLGTRPGQPWDHSLEASTEASIRASSVLRTEPGQTAAGFPEQDQNQDPEYMRLCYAALNDEPDPSPTPPDPVASAPTPSPDPVAFTPKAPAAGGAGAPTARRATTEETDDRAEFRGGGRVYFPPWPGQAGVPKAPYDVKPAVIPGAPLLPEGASDDTLITWLVNAYAGACADPKTGRRPFVPPAVINRHRAAILEGARAMIARKIAPAEWAVWSVGVLGKYMARGEGSPPPFHLVWSENRMALRQGWFAHDGGGLGGRSLEGAKFRELCLRHRTMRERLLATRSDAEVAAVVARCFPGDLYDRLRAEATQEANDNAARLAAMRDAGKWLWS